MATIRAYTTIEQSHKLIDILPIESADMHYVATYASPSEGIVEYRDIPELGYSKPYTPCWSLTALRNLLPSAIRPNKDSYLFLFESHNTFDNSWIYRYYNEDDTSYLYCKNTNEVDVCYEMILKLHKMNLL